MNGIQQFFKNFWEIFKKPLADVTLLEFLIGLLIATVLFFVVKYILKFLKQGFTSTNKVTKVFIKGWLPKTRAAKVSCLHCGRSLDKCVCEANIGRSNLGKLRKHKKEVKELNKK